MGVGDRDTPAGCQALGSRWVSNPSALPPLLGPRRPHRPVSVSEELSGLGSSPRLRGSARALRALGPQDLAIPGSRAECTPRLCARHRGGEVGLAIVRSLWRQDPAWWDQARERAEALRGQCTELERSGRRGQEKTAQPGSPPREQSHGPLRWCVNSGCILALILLSS